MKKIYSIEEQNLSLITIKKIKRIKINKKNISKINCSNQNINYQVKIYFDSFFNNKKNIKRNSKLYSSFFLNSSFAKNNLGNFYKQDKKYKEAIKHYLIALKKKDDTLNFSVDIKKILKMKNLAKDENNFNFSKNMHEISSLYTFVLVQFRGTGSDVETFVVFFLSSFFFALCVFIFFMSPVFSMK